MNTQIRNLGIFLTLCYVILFVQLNRYTVFDAKDLQEHSGNHRQANRDFSAPRGTISTADGKLLAQSVPTKDKYKLQRVYHGGILYPQIVGTFNPLATGTTGVEKTYNKELAGKLDFGLDQLKHLFDDDEKVGNVTLTVRDDLMHVAQDRLAGRKGSAVVLDPRDGSILAAYSNPSYNPQPLASHNFGQALAYADALDKNPDKPRLARWYQDNLPPGSTFKVVTSTAGVEYAGVTPEKPVYPEELTYRPPTAGTEIHNAGGGTCGGTLFVILARSCDTSFAQMGAEMKAENLATTAKDFGFDEDVPLDLPRPARSTLYGASPCPAGPDGLKDPPIRAQSAIGGRCVRATPLQMALVAAAVATGGHIKKPHVLKEIRDQDGNKVRGPDDGEWTTAMSPETAGVMKEAMKGVVDNGTARDLDNQLTGDWEVGAKTGTAPLPDRSSSHAWIIAFAGPPGQEPQVVVAVVVEGQPGLGEQYGARVAGPVGAALLKAALEPTGPQG
jgi:peptidoglycan glycosyltransferase